MILSVNSHEQYTLKNFTLYIVNETELCGIEPVAGGHIIMDGRLALIKEAKRLKCMCEDHPVSWVFRVEFADGLA